MCYTLRKGGCKNKIVMAYDGGAILK